MLSSHLIRERQGQRPCIGDRRCRRRSRHCRWPTKTQSWMQAQRSRVVIRRASCEPRQRLAVSEGASVAASLRQRRRPCPAVVGKPRSASDRPEPRRRQQPISRARRLPTHCRRTETSLRDRRRAREPSSASRPRRTFRSSRSLSIDLRSAETDDLCDDRLVRSPRVATFASASTRPPTPCALRRRARSRHHGSGGTTSKGHHPSAQSRRPPVLPVREPRCRAPLAVWRPS